MYKRLYTFLNKNNAIHSIQFGFTQQCSTSLVLINITKIIRKALGEGKIGSGVFVDLQKGFVTVDRKVLLAKLNHYGICGFPNDWLISFFLIGIHSMQG